MVRASAVVVAVSAGVSAGLASVLALGAVGAAPGAVDPAPAPGDGAQVVGEQAVPPLDDAPHPRMLVPPVDPPVVVARPFDAPAVPWGPGHRGVDLTARPGQAVRAPGPGVVTFAGTVVDRGVVTVTHDDGLRSSVEPVDATVSVGQRVARGDAVGAVSTAAGHCSPATCLHWGLRRGETYLDPMRWVLGGPVVLLPEG